VAYWSWGLGLGSEGRGFELQPELQEILDSVLPKNPTKFFSQLQVYLNN